ncbi:uncharacterized protein [Struthio camelus]
MYNTPEIASTLGEGCGRFKGSAEKASARSPCSSRTALGASQPLSRGRLWQQAPSLAAQPRSSPAVGKTAGHLLLTAWGLTPGGAACICRGRRGQPPAPEPGHPPGPSATAPWPTLCETAKQKYLLRAPACYASSLTICHRHQAFVYNNTNFLFLEDGLDTTLCPCWGAGCEAARKLPRRPEVQQKEEARGGKGPARLQAPRRVAQLRRYQTQRSDQAGGGIGDGEQDFLVGKAADVVPEPRAGDRLQNRPCRRSCRKQLLKESGD